MTTLLSSLFEVAHNLTQKQDWGTLAYVGCRERSWSEVEGHEMEVV